MRTPDAEALVLGARRIRYRELVRDVDAIARALLAAGVRRGDRVATLLPPQPDFFVQFLAAASIGAIWVGLNPRYQREELAFVLNDCRPLVVFLRARIGARDYSEDLVALRAEHAATRWVTVGDTGSLEGCTPLTEFLSEGAAVREETLAQAREAVRTGDPAVVIYTSGSTGQPKGALLPHRGLSRCCRVQYRHWATQPLRTLNFFPINHIASLGDITCFALVAGGSTVFLEQFDPAACLRLIAAERITLWGGVPTTFLLTLRDPAFPGADLSSVQKIVWSGAAASADLVNTLGELGKWLGTSYGLTETVGSMTFTAPDATHETLIESVGRPVEGYAFRIVDEHGQAVERGQTGEIQVRGDFLMTGYWQRPQASAAAFDADGWFRTGDLAFQRADGNVVLVGRRQDAFKSGGYNVYPREIEQVLERCSGVRLAAVIAIPEQIYGAVGHAFVVPEQGAPLSEAALIEHCRRHLANYKVPKRITVIEDPPMLPVGKIDKRELARRALSTPR
jgi:fatty-acyl-CoA synthase